MLISMTSLPFSGGTRTNAGRRARAEPLSEAEWQQRARLHYEQRA